MGNRAAEKKKQQNCHPRHVSIELAMINGDYFWLQGGRGKRKAPRSEKKLPFNHPRENLISFEAFHASDFSLSSLQLAGDLIF